MPVRCGVLNLRSPPASGLPVHSPPSPACRLHGPLLLTAGFFCVRSRSPPQMHRQHARSLSALSHHRMRPGCASPRPSPPSPSPLAKISPRSVKKTPPAPNSSMKAGGTRHRPRHGHSRDAPPAPAAATAGSSPPQRPEPRKKEKFPPEREEGAASAEQLLEGGRLTAQTAPRARQAVPCLSGWSPRKKFSRSVKKTPPAPNSSMKAGDSRHRPRHGHGRDAPPAPAADTAGSSLSQRLEPRKKIFPGA